MGVSKTTFSTSFDKATAEAFCLCGFIVPAVIFCGLTFSAQMSFIVFVCLFLSSIFIIVKRSAYSDGKMGMIFWLAAICIFLEHSGYEAEKQQVIPDGIFMMFLVIQLLLRAVVTAFSKDRHLNGLAWGNVVTIVFFIITRFGGPWAYLASFVMAHGLVIILSDWGRKKTR